MIFMQKMQYNASNSMHVFQTFSGGVTLRTPFWCSDPESGPLPFNVLAARLRPLIMHIQTIYQKINKPNNK